MDKEAIRLIAAARLLQKRAQIDAPHYRAASDPQANCGLCRYFVRATECNLYNFAADPDYVCGSFAQREPDQGQIKAMIEKLGARNSRMDLGMLQQIHDMTCKLGAECNCE